jgi:hypothetical protein
MHVRILIASLLVAGATAVAGPEEPIQPITPPKQINLGMAELKTLTGDQPNFQLPALAPSSDNKTPRPQPFGK